MSESADREPESVTIADPEDYNTTRRLKQIHKARERVPQTIREEGERVATNGTDGEIDKGRYRELVKDALIDYLIELEPLMLDDEIEIGEKYWREKEVETDVDGEPITLERIVDDNGMVTAEDGDDYPIPVPMSRAAYRLANRFLNEIGFGLEVDNGLPRDKI